MASRPTIAGYMLLRDTELTAGEGGSNLLQPGGLVLPFIGAAVLNVGDVVFLSAARTVNKSVLPADHQKRIGVVVGGDATGMEAGTSLATWGTRPANTIGNPSIGPNVLVMLFGVVYVVCDGVIAGGTPIAPSITTAGRVRAATPLSITAGAVAVTSSAANGAADISGDGQTRILGHLIDDSAGAGSIVLATIGLN